MKNKKWTPFKIIKTVWFTLAIGFTVFLFYSSQAKDVADNVLTSESLVKVEDNDKFYAFTPKSETKNVLIFYPGAMVQTKAYAPLCKKLAENNIKVYLIKMPWRLASNGYNIPKELGLFADTSKQYVLAGHSQGAKMSAQFVYENLGLIDKLILIGTTHPRDISLANADIPILKIYGANDGVADVPSILANKPKLPNTAKFVEIAGANHSQFGYYGFQLGDNSATISREEQQALTLKHILNFVQN
ncbi:MAG: alpha/beta hydrolase [Flavobacterium sp.]|nr:MAG: alpha/beta hydrolase [Flavobacterium sp.]